MHVWKEGETGTISNSESSHDIWPFFPVPKIVFVCGTGPKNKWSKSGQTIRQVGKKPPCLVVLSKCLFKKTDWMVSSHSTLTKRTKCNQKVLNHFAVCISAVIKTRLANPPGGLFKHSVIIQLLNSSEKRNSFLDLENLFFNIFHAGKCPNVDVNVAESRFFTNQ